MTIDEVTNNLEYGTKQLEMEIESGLWIKGSESELCCKEGIALNKQLIDWLTELKDLRVKVKQMEKDYVELEEINSRHMLETDNLLDVVRKDYRTIMEFKRLLKSALEDFDDMRTCLAEPYARLCGSKWRYADEAESLIRDIEDRTNDN